MDKLLSPGSGDEARPAQGRAPWLLKGTQRPVGCRIICQVRRAPQAPEEDVRNWPNQPRVWVHLPPAARRSAQTGPPAARGLLPSCQSPHLGPPTASSPVCPQTPAGSLPPFSAGLTLSHLLRQSSSCLPPPGSPPRFLTRQGPDEGHPGAMGALPEGQEGFL